MNQKTDVLQYFSFHLPCHILAMITFSYHRRFNALMRLQNTISCIACGVSDRSTMDLHFLRLTTSRQTGWKAMIAFGKTFDKINRTSIGKDVQLLNFYYTQ